MDATWNDVLQFLISRMMSIRVQVVSFEEAMNIRFRCKFDRVGKSGSGRRQRRRRTEGRAAKQG